MIATIIGCILLFLAALLIFARWYVRERGPFLVFTKPQTIMLAGLFVIVVVATGVGYYMEGFTQGELEGRHSNCFGE